MTTHPADLDAYVKEREELFIRRFVLIDHGPDADDHDCQPDEWKWSFKVQTDAEQIEAVQTFTAETIAGVLERVRKEIEDGYKNMQTNGYPPYAMNVFEDRNRFTEWVLSRLSSPAQS